MEFYNAVKQFVKEKGYKTASQNANAGFFTYHLQYGREPGWTDGCHETLRADHSRGASPIGKGMRMTEFYGTVSIKNIKKVAELIKKKLEEKRYIFVTVNEFFNYKPIIKTNQQMESISVKKEEKYGFFHVVDTYGVWGLSTSQLNDSYDPSFNAPYISIKHKEILMTHRAPTGNLLHWAISIEDEDNPTINETKK